MSAPNLERRGQSILVVDDDAAVRRVFERILTRSGFAVRQAATGEDALTEIAHHSTDVVVLDACMPGIGGIDVVRRLRAAPETRTLPVIMVTGQTDVTERVHGLEAGADDYLAKPADPDELVARVRALLRGNQAWRQALDEMWRLRSDLVDGLSRIQREVDEPNRALAAACELLVGVPGVAAAAVTTFQGERVRLVASTGFPNAQVGRVEAPRVGERLRRHAREGPWTDDMQPRPARSHGGAVAYAPLVSHDQLLGVLALGADPDLGSTPFEHMDPTLATAIDIAPAVAELAAELIDTSDRAELRRSITDTISASRFSIVFQPIVRLADGTTIGYEALARFDDGTPPDQWFEQAARLGLGIPLERAVLEATVREAVALPSDCSLSVNVSPSALLDASIRDVLAQVRGRTLVLELTERERIDDYAAVLDAYAQLPGALRCVDDAGAGYASLRHIFALRPHYIKLDLSWVRDLDTDPARQALVAGLVHFAGITDATVVAEGIERQEEADIVAELGVQLGQGFFFAQPRSAARRATDRAGSRRRGR
jgi:EAL domain-containing protein (putative c-di-GMP-specific phosphodiesterase class I)/CheY-like chemotaxis protein